ncbi:MAG TPA: hypothetical protein GXZ98_06205 [Firmicutes bacterium]|jgi:UDP-GlcNAc:undecaprenyl-phosphate GlcNAc-1-phosphate transferase|nr:hypothetical protein [Bacillota bacterium]
MTLFLLLISSYLLVQATLPLIARLLTKAGMLKENYRQELIPATLGLIFPLVLPVFFLMEQGLELLGFALGLNWGLFYAFLFYTTGFGLLGLADDLLKNDEAKGIRQHLSVLCRGELTSGGVKALFGLVFSIMFSLGVHLIRDGSWWLLIPQILVAALAPNILNLFDLRPGRAVKVFLAGMLLLMVNSYLDKGLNTTLYLGIPILGAVLSYLPFDLKGQAMLGDTGANFLGGAFGSLVVLDGDPLFLGLTLLIFIGLQLMAEKISFTQLIEKNRILKFLDDMGRE